MEAMLKATEVAQLMGCSKEYVTRMAREGRLEHEKTLNERNRPMLLFPVSGLEPQLQQKYYAQLKANLPEVRLPDGAGPKCKTPKAFDQYTADEREEIAWWLKTVDEWQTYRAKYPGKKAEADEKFIALCAKIDPEHEFSIDILYRKWKAVKDNDLDGLIDKRGKWRKGKSSIDETLWQAFLSFYLDENQHPIMRCYEYTKMWAREDFPDLVADMPSYGGAVAADHGKPRIQVYQEQLYKKRIAPADELALMLMRSSRPQKVTRRGVHLDIAGERIDYWNDDMLMNLLGKQVYFRYDPDDLSEVRIYDLEDHYIMSVPADNTAVLKYGASKEDVKEAMGKVRRMERLTKEALKVSAFPAFGKRTALELVMASAHEGRTARLAAPAPEAKILDLQRANEEPLLRAAGDNTPDLDRMTRNARKRNGGNDDE